MSEIVPIQETIEVNGSQLDNLASGDNFVITALNAHTSRHIGKDYTVSNMRADNNEHTIAINFIKYTPTHTLFNKLLNSESGMVTIKKTAVLLVDGKQRIITRFFEHGTITAKPADTYNDTDGNPTMTITFNAREK